MKLEDPDDDDEVDNCTIVIGLIQKGRRKQKRVGAQNLTIGFSIYKVRFYSSIIILLIASKSKIKKKLKIKLLH